MQTANSKNREVSLRAFNFQQMIQPLPAVARFDDPTFDIWCGSMVSGDDSRYHLFYSRWPHALGHRAWVTHSEIAHAVADHPLGPYNHQDVALPPRGRDFWDGLCTHNPTVQQFGSMYYLYYMGNTGDGQELLTLNWTNRNNQRIGVAIADNPQGLWTRFDEPLISPTAGFYDALCCISPPSATVRRGHLLSSPTRCSSKKGFHLRLRIPSYGSPTRAIGLLSKICPAISRGKAGRSCCFNQRTA